MLKIFKLFDYIAEKIMKWWLRTWWDDGLVGLMIFWIEAHNGISKDNYLETLENSLEDISKKEIERHFSYLEGVSFTIEGSGIYITDLGREYIDSILEESPKSFVFCTDGEGNKSIVTYEGAYALDLDVHYDFSGNYNQFKKNTDELKEIFMGRGNNGTTEYRIKREAEEDKRKSG